MSEKVLRLSIITITIQFLSCRYIYWLLRLSIGISIGRIFITFCSSFRATRQIAQGKALLKLLDALSVAQISANPCRFIPGRTKTPTPPSTRGLTNSIDRREKEGEGEGYGKLYNPHCARLANNVQSVKSKINFTTTNDNGRRMLRGWEGGVVQCGMYSKPEIIFQITTQRK